MKMRNPTNYQRKQYMGVGKGGPGNGRRNRQGLEMCLMPQVLITLVMCHNDRR